MEASIESLLSLLDFLICLWVSFRPSVSLSSSSLYKLENNNKLQFIATVVVHFTNAAGNNYIAMIISVLVMVLLNTH